jgi:hypothetical protein
MSELSSTVLTQIALWSEDEGLDLSMGQGDDLRRRILSAIEPAAPQAETMVGVYDIGLIASDRACYEWPEDDQADLRDAYVQGAQDFAAPSPQPSQEPVSEIAQSVAEMVIEWVDGGIKFDTEWRSGLPKLIEKRLLRFYASPQPTYDDGLEAAAKWHDDRAAQHSAALSDSDFDGNEWHAGQAALHSSWAAAIRALEGGGK